MFYFILFSTLIIISVLIGLLIILSKIHSVSKTRLMIINTIHDDVNRIKCVSVDNTEAISLLTTSIEELMKENPHKKKLPTPETSSMIEKTIKEQIAIELTLASDMRAPSKDALKTIVTNTIETYPQINEKYITKKCLMLVESFVKGFL